MHNYSVATKCVQSKIFIACREILNSVESSAGVPAGIRRAQASPRARIMRGPPTLIRAICPTFRAAKSQIGSSVAPASRRHPASTVFTKGTNHARTSHANQSDLSNTPGRARSQLSPTSAVVRCRQGRRRYVEPNGGRVEDPPPRLRSCDFLFASSIRVMSHSASA